MCFCLVVFFAAQLKVKHCFVLSFFGGWGELKHSLFTWFKRLYIVIRQGFGDDIFAKLSNSK